MTKPLKTDTIARAAIVQFISKSANVVVQTVVTVVLARLLTPTEYGTVAVLSVFMGFFSILSDVGISSAVVQFRDLTQVDFRLLFTFTLLFGLALSIIFYLVCIGAVFIYSEPEYYGLGFVLALAVWLNAANMVPNGILLREKRFDLIGLRLIVCNAGAGLLTIMAALIGFGPYALVFNSAASASFVLLWNLGHSKLKPQIADFRSPLQKVWKYSLFQFGHECVGYFAKNADSLIAGKLFGASALGYYNKAFSLYGFPQSYIMGSITSTLRPFFAEFQDDREQMYRKLVNVAKSVSLLAALCTCILTVCGSEVVLVLFGDQWGPAGELLQILALSIYAQSMNHPLAAVMGSTNRTDLLMISTTLNSLFTLIMIVLGASSGGIIGMAIFVVVAFNIEAAIPLYLAISKCLNASIARYTLIFLPEVLIAIAIIISGSIIPWGIDNLLLSLLAKLTFCLIAFTILCLIAGQGFYMRRALESLRH